MAEPGPEGLDKNTARAAHRDEVEQRRAAVAEFVACHLPYRDIARRLGVSHGTVGNDVAVIRERWRKRALDSYESHVAEQVARLDRLEQAVWPLAIGDGDTPPDYAACDRVLRVMERRARLLALDRPPRVDARARGTADVEVRHSIQAELVRDDPDRLHGTIIALRECGFLAPDTVAGLDTPPS